MSITLDTLASERVNGRCVDCGRFLSRHDVHFHGPKRRFSGPPRTHLFLYGEGGIVTRCDDIEQARKRLIAKYKRDIDNYEGEAEAVFAEGKGRVERGRINVQPPESDYSWYWMTLPDDARGPGITTGVVWS